MSFFIVGDIHGHFTLLSSLMKKVIPHVSPGDVMIFLGDYIDRGDSSFEVIEFLLALAKRYRTVFLKGNHEDMMLKFLAGRDGGDAWLMNGGRATIRSYRHHLGSFSFPERHKKFFSSLRLYYEGDDFIAVHAGLHPLKKSMDQQRENDMIWIRDIFYRADKKWEKTVIFGHTPASLLKKEPGVLIDEARNIIAMDNGVIFGNPLACLRWPDRKIFYS